MKSLFSRIVLVCALVSVTFFGGSVPNPSSGALPYVVYAQQQESISGDGVCGSSSSTKCTPRDFGVIVKKTMFTVIAFGLPFLVTILGVRFAVAWFRLREGNAAALKEARDKAWKAITGFLIVTALIGGLFGTLLAYISVKPEYRRILELFSTVTIERAYAADPIQESECSKATMGAACLVSGGSNANAEKNRLGTCAERDVELERLRYYCRSNNAGSACPTGTTQGFLNGKATCLTDAELQAQITAAGEASRNSTAGQMNSIGDSYPNNSQNTNNPGSSGQQSGQRAPSGGKSLPNPLGVNSLYDFLLQALRLVMRFFVYPAVIVIWVWTGFSFVAAQGAPDKLNKAKKLLWWGFIITLTVFMLQGFLVALQGTVNKILSP